MILHVHLVGNTRCIYTDVMTQSITKPCLLKDQCSPTTRHGLTIKTLRNLGLAGHSVETSAGNHWLLAKFLGKPCETYEHRPQDATGMKIDVPICAIVLFWHPVFPPSSKEQFHLPWLELEFQPWHRKVCWYLSGLFCQVTGQSKSKAW